MKKNYKFDTKGFMLVETLLVSLTIAGILVYMYAQFSTINTSYQRLYSFNTSDSLYRAGVIREFIVNYVGSDAVDFNGNGAKDFKCPEVGLSENDKKYCEGIKTAVSAKKMIVTTRNFNEDKVLDLVGPKEKALLTRFFKAMNKDGKGEYRLIVIFEDDTAATVLFDL